MLDLSGTKITDANMRTVGKLGDLQDLRLTYVKVTDDGVKQLAGLTKLHKPGACLHRRDGNGPEGSGRIERLARRQSHVQQEYRRRPEGAGRAQGAVTTLSQSRPTFKQGAGRTTPGIAALSILFVESCRTSMSIALVVDALFSWRMETHEQQKTRRVLLHLRVRSSGYFKFSVRLATNPTFQFRLDLELRSATSWR
jgi:hypothetical protein